MYQLPVQLINKTDFNLFIQLTFRNSEFQTTQNRIANFHEKRLGKVKLDTCA